MLHVVAVLVGATLFCLIPSKADAFGFQVQATDKAGGTVANGIAFDAYKKRLFVTGSTTGTFFGPSAGSSCFFGILQLPIRPGDTDPVWLRRFKIGQNDEGSREACSFVHAEFNADQENTAVYLAGYSVNDTSLSGMILDVSLLNGVQGGFQFDSTSQQQYPLYLETSSSLQTLNRDLYVASMMRSNSLPTRMNNNTLSYISDMNDDHYSLIIQRVSLKQDFNNVKTVLPAKGLQDSTLHQVWKQNLQSQTSLHLTGMLLLNDRLLVANNNNINSGHQAFLSLLDTSSGNILNSRRVADRAQSLTVADDSILGLCHHETTVFAVGTTNGNLFGQSSASSTTINQQGSNFQAFLLKLNPDTLQTEWATQLGAITTIFSLQPTVAQGVACAVASDGSSVYIAGNVRGGAVLSTDGVNPLTQSLGNDDIFVAKFLLTETEGQMDFVVQVGSDQDDYVASGKGLICDDDNNAIVLGNTKGLLFDVGSAEPSSEGNLVVFSVDGTTGAVGKIPGQVVPNRPSPKASAEPNFNFYPDEREPLFGAEPPQNSETVPEPLFFPDTQQGRANAKSSSSNRKGFIVGVAIVGNVLALSSLALYGIHRQQKNERRKQHGPKYMETGKVWSSPQSMDGRYQDECSSTDSRTSRDNDQFYDQEDNAHPHIYLTDDHMYHNGMVRHHRLDPVPEDDLYYFGGEEEYDSEQDESIQDSISFQYHRGQVQQHYQQQHRQHSYDRSEEEKCSIQPENWGDCFEESGIDHQIERVSSHSMPGHGIGSRLVPFPHQTPEGQGPTQSYFGSITDYVSNHLFHRPKNTNESKPLNRKW